MEIYTSYFNNRDLPKDFVRISIARFTPKWEKCPVFLECAPSIRLLNEYKNEEIDRFQYRRRYTDENLSKLHYTEFMEKIKNVSKERPVVLLCYEKDGFCHRHLLSEWLNKNGEEVYEF